MLPVLVELVSDNGFVIGVVFAHLVQLVLVLFDLLHERGTSGKGGCVACAKERAAIKAGKSAEAQLHKTSNSGYAGTVNVVPC